MYPLQPSTNINSIVLRKAHSCNNPSLVSIGQKNSRRGFFHDARPQGHYSTFYKHPEQQSSYETYEITRLLNCTQKM